MKAPNKDVCKLICPYSDKGSDGACLLALYHQKPRDKVCQCKTDIDIRVK